MKEYLGQDVLDIGRNGDGKLYGIVAKRATTAKSNTFIRKDWLDELNLDVPTPTDELYQVIEQMTNNPDAIQDYYDEGMRDYYRFMNRMYNNGLLNQEYYTMSEDNFKSYIVTGAAASFEYSVNDGKQYSAAYASGGLIAFCHLTADGVSILKHRKTQQGRF